MDHCAPKINSKCASLCVAPRSSGIQCLRKHELNLPPAASGVFYIDGFYCSPPAQEYQFPRRRKQVRSLPPIRRICTTMVWSELFLTQWAAVTEVTLSSHTRQLVIHGSNFNYPLATDLLIRNNCLFLLWIFKNLKKSASQFLSQHVCNWIVVDTENHETQSKEKTHIYLNRHTNCSNEI